jgi:hypothetical protein
MSTDAAVNSRRRAAVQPAAGAVSERMLPVRRAQAFSLAAICATCRPWNRAPASSLSDGTLLGLVEAPYGEPPTISGRHCARGALTGAQRLIGELRSRCQAGIVRDQYARGKDADVRTAGRLWRGIGEDWG